MLIYRTESVDYLKDDSLFAQYYARVPAYRKLKIDALMRPEDRRLSLGAELLLENVLREAGFPELSEARDIALTERGKPYFENKTSNSSNAETLLPFFCLSHSGERVMCALSDKPVGCDIEKATRSLSECIALARRFFSAEEAAAVENAAGEVPGDDGAVSMFYRLWTAKEAYAKCLDVPLNKTLKQVQCDGEGLKQVQGDGDGYFWTVVVKE